jgi:drug/metabolite transporter (DMT)-like permease
LTDNKKAHIGLILTNLFFGLNYTTVKHLTNNQFIGPFGINVVRVAVAVILFWLLFLFKPGKASINKKDIPRFVLCAITGVAINQLLFIKGLSLTYSIHASLLILITPILITIFAAFVLREKVGITKIAGLVLGIIGALVLILNRQNTGSGSNVLLGDVFIIINAVSYTIYFILVKPLMSSYNAVHVIRWVFTFGVIMVLPFGWQEFSQVNWPSFTVTEYACLFMVVVLGTFFTYLFNVYGIKVLGASVAGNYIYTQPFFAAGIAMIFLKEPLDLYKVLAAILIFTGVYITGRK